jgi:putative transposase
LNPPERTGAPVPHRDRLQPAQLTAAEKARVLQIVSSPEYADLSVTQAFYRALDAGIYVCSLASFHRTVRAAGQSGDRRRQACHPPRTIPHLHATGCNQVWSWDITMLKGERRNRYYRLYAMMDIYSRYVVGWRVENFEDQRLAARMMADAAEREGTGPAWLHSDNGPSMTGSTVAGLLARLGIGRSFSRPGVSNDNPYSEALFKTLKYGPAFPDRFGSLDHAREFCAWFFDEYNHRHRHSGIGWHTPASVHHGHAHEVARKRQAVLDAAWKRHPERHRHRPTTPRLPREAWINNPNTQPNLSQPG